MRAYLVTCAGAAALALAAGAYAQSVAVSIGIRETVAGGGPVVDIGQNGGTAGGIEFVNLDGQTLLLNNTWQTFTFNFQGDELTGFAGGTANSMYDGTRGVLEMIRFRNVDGITSPGVRVWVDAIVNTVAGTPNIVSGFEGTDPIPATVGAAHMFQVPNFSGSTAALLVPPPAGPNLAVVTDQESFTGTNSLQVEWEWNTDAPTSWLRLTTFGPSGGVPQPNPAIDFRDGSTLTFAIKGVVIPEPASAGLLGIASLGLLVRRRRA